MFLIGSAPYNVVYTHFLGCYFGGQARRLASHLLMINRNSMQTVSVTIDRFVEEKFENLLNEYGYEFSKHYHYLSDESNASSGSEEVSFVLTSEDEFDLIELGMLNECARQIQQLERLDLENYRNLFEDVQFPRVQDERLLQPKNKFSN